MKEAEVRSLATVEKTPSLDSITIDSENFVDYLLYPKFDAQESRFSPHLDLEWCTPVINYLYDQTQEEFYHTDEEKDILTRFWSKLPEESKSKIEELINIRVPVERSSIIYYEIENDTIRVSPANFGHFTSGEVELSIFDGDNFPIMELHTHPFNSLFSPVDYTRLLLGGDGMRAVKSSMVICPDIQVL
ncbi:MAG: hypothetical protein AAB583_00910, partial [Patescibacteria group bacterium]